MSNTKLRALGKVGRAFDIDEVGYSDIDEVGYSSFNADASPAVRRSSGPSHGERSKIKRFFTIGQIAELLEVSTRTVSAGTRTTPLHSPCRAGACRR
jgi:hypothetical protein